MIPIHFFLTHVYVTKNTMPQTAFCVKCRTKTDMKDPQERTNAKGVRMLQGTCNTCSAKVNTFVKRNPTPAS